MNLSLIDRVKRIRSHSGHAQFLAECAEDAVGHIERQLAIPSPYAYSPEWPVLDHHQFGYVVIRETSHRVFDVFEVPRSMIQGI